MYPQKVFARYRSALVTNDMQKLVGTLSEDVVGYELDDNYLASRHQGRHEVLEMIRRKYTGQDRSIDTVTSGTLVAALVNTGERHVDIFRIRDGAIVEAWMDWDRG